MKGIVFNLLEECVTRAHGEDTWDLLLERAGLVGAYTSLGTYPDRELHDIVVAASKELGLGADDLTEWFAVQAASMFAERFPSFYASHRSTRTFLATLDDIIHPEVKKLFPDAETPKFEIEPRPGKVFAMHYRSRRSMCRFAAGLVTGTAPRFGETAIITHETCKKNGADHCVLLIELEKIAA